MLFVLQQTHAHVFNTDRRGFDIPGKISEKNFSFSEKNFSSRGSGMAAINKLILGRTFMFIESIQPQIVSGRILHLSICTLMSLIRFFK